MPWSCDWHVVEPGLQGLPQPLTEVAFLPTLSPRLLTLGGQTFPMPLSCQNRSSSTKLGLEPPEQLSQGTENACKEPMQWSHRKARRSAQQTSSHHDASLRVFCWVGTVSLETENEQTEILCYPNV